MINERALHNEGDSNKEQRITHLKNRVNQLKQKYPDDIATRKTIETVVKPTKNIHLDYVADKAQGVEQHTSLLNDFQL